MSEHLIQIRRRVSDVLPSTMTRAQRVGLFATILVSLQLVIRAWAAWGGSFYADDFALLSMTRTHVDTDLLTTPFRGNLMPLPLAIAWVVSHCGAFPWPAAAGFSLLLQTAAGWAAWVMLRTLFGSRYASLVPLAIFLFSPLTLVTSMWWSAAITLVPLQIAIFVSVTAHVRFISGRRPIQGAVAVLAMAGGLLADPRALLILPLLVLVTLVTIDSALWFPRLLGTLSGGWPLWMGYLALSAAYLFAHSRWVDSSLLSTGNGNPAGTVGGVVAKTFLPLMVGGPLDWEQIDSPGSLADPPLAMSVIAAVVLILTVGYTVLRRSGSWAPAFVLATYVVGEAAFLAMRPAGPSLAMDGDPRFVIGSSAVVPLVLALMFIPTRLPGIRGSVARAGSPDHRPAAALVTAAMLAGAGASVVSTLAYVSPWHSSYAAKVYVDNATNTTRRTGDVDVIDVSVPQTVMAPSLSPYILTSRFFNGDSRVHARTSGNDLRTFDRGGFLRVPEPVGGVSSPPPTTGTCGVIYRNQKKQSRGAVNEPSIELSGRGSTDKTWLTINYVSSADAVVTIDSGTDTRTIEVLRGAHTYVMRPTEEISAVSFSELTPDTTLCIGTITVAPLTASTFS